MGISWLHSSSGISRNQQRTSRLVGALLTALTCAHFLLTVLDMVIFKLQLLHVRAGNAWNVRKVGGGCFGNRRIAAFHQELTVINNPGTWGGIGTRSGVPAQGRVGNWMIFRVPCNPKHSGILGYLSGSCDAALHGSVCVTLPQHQVR